jgi:multiple sugar transport system permease protein
MNKPDPARAAITVVVVAVILFATLFPILWQMRSSFVTRSNLYASYSLIPVHPIVTNYVEVWRSFHFARDFFNTLFVTLCVVVGTVLSCSLAGFSFARMRFPGRGFLFSLYLATLMIPFAVTLVPSYVLIVKLGWINRYESLIAPFFFGNALGTFLMRQHYASQPRELLEAAFLDGASWWTIWRRVMMPLGAATLTTLTVITTQSQWNNFLWPIIVTQTDSIKTLAVGLSDFRLDRSLDFAKMAAGVMMGTLPMIAILFGANKAFLKGVQLQGVNR